jgi:hypothetical protein
MRDAGLAVAGERSTLEQVRRWASIQDDPAQPPEDDLAEFQAWRLCDEQIVAAIGMN